MISPFYRFQNPAAPTVNTTITNYSKSSSLVLVARASAYCRKNWKGRAAARSWRRDPRGSRRNGRGVPDMSCSKNDPAFKPNDDLCWRKILKGYCSGWRSRTDPRKNRCSKVHEPEPRINEQCWTPDCTFGAAFKKTDAPLADTPGRAVLRACLIIASAGLRFGGPPPLPNNKHYQAIIYVGNGAEFRGQGFRFDDPDAPTCRDWMAGRCFFGPKCRYRHDRAECRHFLRGYCEFGENCRDRHPERHELQYDYRPDIDVCTRYHFNRRCTCDNGFVALRGLIDMLPMEYRTRPILSQSAESIANYFTVDGPIYLVVDEVLDVISRAVRHSVATGETAVIAVVCRQGRHRSVMLQHWIRRVCEELGIAVGERTFHRDSNERDWGMRGHCGCQENNCENARYLAMESGTNYDYYLLESARSARIPPSRLLGCSPSVAEERSANGPTHASSVLGWTPGSASPACSVCPASAALFSLCFLFFFCD